MDKSREYILMCGQAHEIQKLWGRSYGDFFVGENGRIECWITERDQGRHIRRGFCIRVKDDLIQLARYVWLPRLNQLMELAQVAGQRFENTTLEFFDWTKSPYASGSDKPATRFKSLEQLWLAYVMQRQFGKKWSGSEWTVVGG